MHGPRGINLPVADTRDILQKPFEFYGNYKEWAHDVDRVNSELLDDNAEYTSMAGGKTISINGKDFAFWSNRNGNGSIDIGIAKKYGQQGVGEGVDDLKNIDPGELAGSTLGGIAGYMAGDALGGPMVGFGAAGVGSAIGGALAKEGMMSNPGEQDSPVAQAIIRRILLQRTDLLAKHGPEKVGAAVDEVADFVGDVDEIGSSDVSGWVRHVEQMLGNMEQDMAEGSMLNKIKAPAAPSSPALAAPRAPAVAETLRQIDRMLESVNSKKSAEIVKAYADQQFTKLGLHNTTECKQIMAHVVHESAVRRRAYAQRMAK
jgi:hypothetical protein